MKNFSTVGARFVITALFSGAAAAGAHAATTCEFLPNAPDQHLVVKGDTLWDISGKFLQHPWCWGQVWDLNKEQIHNPHWIYPGQIVYFDRKNGRLRLGNGVEGANGDGRLSPRVRIEAIGRDAIPAIPSAVIEPFLSQPLIVEEDELARAPRIVATQENHVYLSNGDKAYVRGELDGAKDFQIFRPGKPLTDPATNKVLGYEAFYLGTMRLNLAAAPGVDVSTFMVESTKQEMGVGDRLVATQPTPLINYVPHAPDQGVDARVMSIYGGVSYAGQNQIVTINRGSLDGLDIGSTLELYHFGRLVDDPTTARSGGGGAQKIKLPDEEYGSLFIFRVFKHISYGLIMQVKEPAQVGDVAKSPE